MTNPWSPPNLCVNLSAFAEDLEKRIAEDEENNTCCVCYELFDSVPLNTCCHKLCSTCYDTLDTCPMCRTVFKNDFANFDGCVSRRSDNRFDVHVYGGKLRQGDSLFRKFLVAALERDVSFYDCGWDRGENYRITGWTNIGIAIELIKKHTLQLNASNNLHPIRRELVHRDFV